MRIALIGHTFIYKGEVVQTYFHSMKESLIRHGHQTDTFSPFEEIPWKEYDLAINVDTGRDINGNYSFLLQQTPIPSILYSVDAHGASSLHRRTAKKFDHVFFAVWDKRDLFTNHPSAHWCPNFTDIKWFNGENPEYDKEPEFDFAMIGSKFGLSRAQPMINICLKNGWTYDVRQVGKQFRHRWPHTAEAMANSRFLFNKGQKHDGPNLRVMESMAMKRPLITDSDPRDGMGQLFIENHHYLGYEWDTNVDLEASMAFLMANQEKAAELARNAYEEVRMNHTVNNRIEQILEVIDD